MDLAGVGRTLAEQSGVISRRQVVAHGGSDTFIETRLRRREWAIVHRGVYVDHTGEPSWQQHAWAAVLFYWPAALSHESSLEVHRIRTSEAHQAVIHVAVDQERRVRAIEGVRVHRVTNLSAMVQPNRSPARIRLEHSLIDVASTTASDEKAIAVLADACQSGRTTPARLLDDLADRPRLKRRRLLVEGLEDVAEGAYSVLEHRYLTRVERPHGLPHAKRQRRVRPGRSAAYRDVEYRGVGCVVELDGRLGHEEQLDQWNDMDRDIDSVVGGDITLRLGWRHVLDPCRTAIAVGRLLTARGWTGQLCPCSKRCPVHEKGDLPAPQAGNAPLFTRPNGLSA